MGGRSCFNSEVTLVIPADFSDHRLESFLEAHLADLAPTAPTEGRHALELSALQRPGVRVWTAADGEQIVVTVAFADMGDYREDPTVFT